MSKICSRCKKEKDSSEFYRRSKRPDLLRSYCKSCHLKKTKMGYIKNGYTTRTPEYTAKKVEELKAHRLGLRLARAELIIDLSAQEFKLSSKYSVLGRRIHLRLNSYNRWLPVEGNEKLAAAVAMATIRDKTFLSLNAIAELFDCATSDVISCIKLFELTTDYKSGDIQVRDKYRHVVKLYNDLKPTSYKQVPVKPYSEYTDAQREDRINRFNQRTRRMNSHKAQFPTRPPENLSEEILLNTACWYYGITREEFYDDSRITGGYASIARFVCMFILREYMGYSLPQIAKLMCRTHPTVMDGIKKGKDYMRVNKGSFYHELEKAVRKNTAVVN